MMCKSSTKMNYERLLINYMYFKYVLGERVYSLSGGCSFPLLFPFFPDSQVCDSCVERPGWNCLVYVAIVMFLLCIVDCGWKGCKVM